MDGAVGGAIGGSASGGIGAAVGAVVDTSSGVASRVGRAVLTGQIGIVGGATSEITSYALERIIPECDEELGCEP